MVPVSIGLVLIAIGVWRARRITTTEIAGHDLVSVLKVRR